jgi:hypothetical protein
VSYDVAKTGTRLHSGYDLIGDIHGCGLTLEALLEKLGYTRGGETYRHPRRTAIFLGDFIDRGPLQREVIDIVRLMIEDGAALSVMGNHEFNAIAYATPGPEGGFLREHSAKNLRQHGAFLDAYKDDRHGYEQAIAWFKTLPLWLDLDGLRIVHACWDQPMIDKIWESQGGSRLLGDELLRESVREVTWEYEAIETLLKGKEIGLSNGASFPDKDGNLRHHIRVKWWDAGATTYREAFMGPESARTHIPDDEIAGDHLIEYAHDSPPVFLGHYWMEDDIKPLAPNIACVDYSVGKAGGRLVAYRWDGEQQLTRDKFVAVERIENAD